jgi:hypothetical protein
MREEVKLDTLPEWTKSIGSLILETEILSEFLTKISIQYLRIKRQTSVGLLFVINMSYLPTWLLIALFWFVKIITFGV